MTDHGVGYLNEPGRFMVERLTPAVSAVCCKDVVDVQCSIKLRNTAALLISLRVLVTEAPQAVQRHRVLPLVVVPLRFMTLPQWQRGRFLGIELPHHRALPHQSCHTVYFQPSHSIYAPRAYISSKYLVQRPKNSNSRHTFGDADIF